MWCVIVKQRLLKKEVHLYTWPQILVLKRILRQNGSVSQILGDPEDSYHCLEDSSFTLNTLEILKNPALSKPGILFNSGFTHLT